MSDNDADGACGFALWAWPFTLGFGTAVAVMVLAMRWVG